MLRVGADLLPCDRVARARQRWGERFLARVLTPREIEDCRGRTESLAVRIAAKEAASKALGVGLMTRVGWRDIEVRRGPQGEPSLLLYGEAARLAETLGLNEWALSLSHAGGQALAVVVAHRAGG
ncbi:MAG: holo-ACP synthase [Chloroflexi bacterium]|nr:holo-ACP synthase [Chloroflexota bacterium]